MTEQTPNISCGGLEQFMGPADPNTVFPDHCHFFDQSRDALPLVRCGPFSHGFREFSHGSPRMLG